MMSAIECAALRGAALLVPFLVMTGCSTSPMLVLEPWPFKEDQVVISCERYDGGKATGSIVAPRVFVTGSSGVRYAANSSARAVAPYMSPLLKEPDQGQVVRQGLLMCENDWPPTSYRRRALIEMG
jgi:hypothetical protein